MNVTGDLQALYLKQGEEIIIYDRARLHDNSREH